MERVPEVVEVWGATDPAEVVERLRQWLTGPVGVPLVVPTSGSTGEPKQVMLSREAVLASVAASADRLGASGPWVLALPSSYVAGVLVIVRSLVAGHQPVLWEQDGWPSGEGWFVSLVPTQLGRMLADLTGPDLAALRRAHTVLLGGGPIDPGLRELAERSGVRTVATYGAAETAGGCVYDGQPLADVRLDFEEDGRIRIAGPTIFSGYRGEPRLTEQALVDGWFRTSDLGRLDDDGRLQVLGRIDDVVVSGGVNIPAPAIAQRLRAHPQVEAVEVLGVPDPEWGNRLVAFVVGALSGDTEAITAELRDWVRMEHPRSWAPRQVLVLPEIPLLANAKPDRVALRALAVEEGR